MFKIGIWIVALCLIACEEPPSCQQAMTHFYGVGCVFRDTNGVESTRGQSIENCVGASLENDDGCQGEFDDWLFCLDAVPGGNDSGCDCSQEFMAVLNCN